MNVPWSHVPEGFDFVAADPYGEVFAYKDKPKLDEDGVWRGSPHRYKLLYDPVSEDSSNPFRHTFDSASESAEDSLRIRLGHYQKQMQASGVDPHEPGAKLDAGKTRVDLLWDFSRALEAVAKVATFGASKYTEDGWQEVKGGVKRYKAAEGRHLLSGQREEVDSDSGLPHSWHRAWNVLAVLELQLREQEDEEDER